VAEWAERMQILCGKFPQELGKILEKVGFFVKKWLFGCKKGLLKGLVWEALNGFPFLI